MGVGNKEAIEIEEFRSACAISSALDLFGDRWSLLIVRDLLYHGDRTFKDFTLSDEKISTSRLAGRLKKLEGLGLLTKNSHPTNRKVSVYRITRKGKDLLPVIAELVVWSSKHLKNHISSEAKAFAKLLKSDRTKALAQFK